MEKRIFETAYFFAPIFVIHNTSCTIDNVIYPFGTHTLFSLSLSLLACIVVVNAEVKVSKTFVKHALMQIIMFVNIALVPVPVC